MVTTPFFGDFYIFTNCVKSVHDRSFSGLHIAAFGLNTEIYSDKYETLKSAKSTTKVIYY